MHHQIDFGSGPRDVGYFRYLALVSAMLMLVGCVGHQPYRLQPPNQSSKWTEWNWNHSHEYFEPVETKIDVGSQATGSAQPAFSVVEFDDHGEYWSRRQPEEALKMLRRSPKKPLTILYVHGWKHNASDQSDDYASFKKLLATLATKPALTKNFSICGIYVGWRGDLIGKWGEFAPRQLTIYNRMNAADRIANGLPFTRFISEVSETTLAERDGRCVMIGHSLGGRMLETTISRTLATAAEPGANAAIRKPADLVVLVNPASDGLRARQTLLGVKWAPKSALPRLTPAGDPGDHYHVPLIVYMKSESDTATSWIYRTAMILGKGVSRKTRLYPTNNGKVDHTQFEYITQTAPTLNHLRSHKVVELPDSEERPILGDDKTALDYNVSNLVAINRFPLTDQGKQIRWYAIVEDTEGEFKMYEPNRKERGSCWIMQVPPAVLDGHGGIKKDNGIFSDSMVDLFAALYRITQPGIPGVARPTLHQRSSAVPHLATAKEQTEPLRNVRKLSKPEAELPSAASAPTPP